MTCSDEWECGHNWIRLKWEWVCIKCGSFKMVSDVHGPHDFDVVGGRLPNDFNVEFGKQNKDEAGLRYDAGKPRYDLIPPEALEALAWVYTKGAEKYADRNWEKGMSWGRCFGAMMRHAWKWWSGKEVDIETGCHHMAMVAWNAFALYYYARYGVGTDDRPTHIPEDATRTS